MNCINKLQGSDFGKNWRCFRCNHTSEESTSEQKINGDFWEKNSALAATTPRRKVRVQIQNFNRELWRDVCPSYFLLKIFNTSVVFWKPTTNPRFPQGNWVPKNHDGADCWESAVEILLTVENVQPAAFGVSFLSEMISRERGGGLGSRPKKMYGKRLGDGVEYHLMSPTPRC